MCKIDGGEHEKGVRAKTAKMGPGGMLRLAMFENARCPEVKGSIPAHAISDTARRVVPLTGESAKVNPIGSVMAAGFGDLIRCCCLGEEM